MSVYVYVHTRVHTHSVRPRLLATRPRDFREQQYVPRQLRPPLRRALVPVTVPDVSQMSTHATA